MSNIVIRPQSREEWLEIRKNGIGSSEVATIVGVNPWETPYQLWRRKVGLDAPKSENFAMKAGHYLEDAVSHFWADETGREIIKSSAGDWIIRDLKRPYLQVSPDRTYWLDGKHNKDNKGILECKTTQMKVDRDDIPAYWFTQLQYQLGVAGYKSGSLAWLCSGREFGYVDFRFVEGFFNGIVEDVDRFWIDCIKGGKEPAPINAEDVIIKYATHTGGKYIEVTDEVFDAYSKLKDVRKELDRLEEERSELEGKLKLAFGDAEGITFEGQTLATWKAPKPSTKFDAKTFQSEHPDIAQPYMVTIQGARRFLLK